MVILVGNLLLLRQTRSILSRLFESPGLTEGS